MLQLKDLWWRTAGEKGTVWDGKALTGLEGLPGGRGWGARETRFEGWKVCRFEGSRMNATRRKGKEETGRGSDSTNTEEHSRK